VTGRPVTRKVLIVGAKTLSTQSAPKNSASKKPKAKKPAPKRHLKRS
jgi:hypothetical protein